MSRKNLRKVKSKDGDLLYFHQFGQFILKRETGDHILVGNEDLAIYREIIVTKAICETKDGDVIILDVNEIKFNK